MELNRVETDMKISKAGRRLQETKGRHDLVYSRGQKHPVLSWGEGKTFKFLKSGMGMGWDIDRHGVENNMTKAYDKVF